MDAVEILRNELAWAMGLAGRPTIASIDRSLDPDRSALSAQAVPAKAIVTGLKFRITWPLGVSLPLASSTR